MDSHDPRLLPRYRIDEIAMKNDVRIAQIMLGPDDVKVTSASPAGGDRLRLRGIPVQANGVGGTMTGTTPGANLQ